MFRRDVKQSARVESLQGKLEAQVIDDYYSVAHAVQDLSRHRGTSIRFGEEKVFKTNFDFTPENWLAKTNAFFNNAHPKVKEYIQNYTNQGSYFMATCYSLVESSFQKGQKVELGKPNYHYDVNPDGSVTFTAIERVVSAKSISDVLPQKHEGCVGNEIADEQKEAIAYVKTKCQLIFDKRSQSVQVKLLSDEVHVKDKTALSIVDVEDKVIFSKAMREERIKKSKAYNKAQTERVRQQSRIQAEKNNQKGAEYSKVMADLTADCDDYQKELIDTLESICIKKYNGINRKVIQNYMQSDVDNYALTRVIKSNKEVANLVNQYRIIKDAKDQINNVAQGLPPAGKKRALVQFKATLFDNPNNTLVFDEASGSKVKAFLKRIANKLSSLIIGKEIFKKKPHQVFFANVNNRVDRLAPRVAEPNIDMRNNR